MRFMQYFANKLIALSFGVSSFLLPFFALGAGEVIINEVAWMGTESSANDEWIELYNKTDSPIDISTWTLEAKDGSPSVSLAGTIQAKGFFLLERSNDDSVPGVNADLIYTGALSNSGEGLVLKDKDGREVDHIDASAGWPAGDNETKETMQRAGLAWETAKPTPRSVNVFSNSSPAPSSPKNEESKEPVTKEEILDVGLPKMSSESNQETSVKPEMKKVAVVSYPQSVFVSEFFPDPEGSDGEGEWIELYNDADAAVNIGGFFLDDEEKGSRQYQFPAGAVIAPKEFLVLSRKESKIALNNKADEVRLFYPDGSLAAKVTYADAREGLSAAYQKETETLFWTSNPTPGKENILSQTIVPASNGNETSYQEANIGSLEALPDFEIGESGVKNDSLAASSGAPSGRIIDQFWIILLALIIGAFSMVTYSRFVKKLFSFLFIGILFFILPFSALADSFFVSPDLDMQSRSQIQATKLWEGSNVRIFLEDGSLAPFDTVKRLGEEFDTVVYPKMINLFGEPWTPGIDNDTRVNILFTRLIRGIGGYFNGDDELSKTQKQTSNEKELLYLNADLVGQKKMSSFMAHEFQHLITFNQKIRPVGKDEEVWLNEVRSEYAPTFLGYDAPFPGSNAQDRYVSFLESPHNNLILWNNTRADYGTVNMFGQYLNARFGEAFFREEMKTGKLGIASLSDALKRMDPGLSFPSFFAQWRLANYVNSENILNGKYSYKNSNLSVRLGPEFSFTLSDPTAKGVETTQAVSSFDAKAIRLVLDDNRATVKVTSQQFSDDLAVAFLKEKSDGTFEDGQYFFGGGEQTLKFGKDTKAATILLSNASSVFSEATFIVNIQVKALSEPAINAIEPVFLHPTPDQNVFFIKGKDFEEGLTLTLNNNPQSFTYQNDSTLLTRVSSNEKIITVKVKNPEGTEALFMWENPLAASLNQSVTALIPDGSLIRARGESKVYIVNNGFKRYVISPAIFSFYGHLDASRIQDVSAQVVEGFLSSTLIRFSESPKVYEVLPDGKKRWIKTAGDFVARGFDWNAIFEVNERELNFYPEVP